jgi:hypothetical protein
MPTTQYECAICAEDRSQAQHPVRIVGGDPICSECIPEVLALFERALKTETSFPPRWGPEEISFEAFEDLFSNDFRLAYRKKVKEYRTPIPERVYCQYRVSSKDKSAGEPETDFCNTFLGSSEQKCLSQCPHCTGWMCMGCCNTACPPPGAHTCADTKDDGQSTAFDQATRGRTWQACPNPECKIKCGLRDACNAMRCLCGTAFCYLCGEEASHDSDHWMQGKPCPRWGAADAPNPMFDQPAQFVPHGFEQGFEVAINPWAGNLIVLDPQQLVREPNDELHFDSDEAKTLVEEFEPEQHFMLDDEGNIQKVILDMMELLYALDDNMSWLVNDWVLSHMNPQIRPFFANPIEQAVETTNFFIRDALLQEKLLETHAAALQITGEDSVLFTMPVAEIFERYNTVHKPVLVENVRQFVAVRDAGRVLHIGGQEDTFADARDAGRMLLLQRQEDQAEQRRASI